jgi:hypothetical protein
VGFVVDKVALGQVFFFRRSFSTYAIRSLFSVAVYNLLQSVITTWRMGELFALVARSDEPVKLGM